MEIIVPAAGLSSRFPNSKPKYLLHDYSGKSMLYKAVEPFLNRHKITIGILREHDEKYNVIDTLKKDFGDLINIIVIPELTSGPAETVYKILCAGGIDLNSEILVKDCDSFFTHKETYGNYICISKIENHNTVNLIHNKSFVIESDQNMVTKIVEKQVVSNMFCVGGYKFQLGYDLKKAFEDIRFNIKTEIFISHVIQRMLLTGHVFQTNEVSNYVDVGTIDDWLKYNKPIDFEF